MRTSSGRKRPAPRWWASPRTTTACASTGRWIAKATAGSSPCPMRAARHERGPRSRPDLRGAGGSDPARRGRAAPQEAAPRRRAGSGLRDEPARDEPPPARSAADQPGGGGQPRRGRARARLPPPAGEVRRAAGMARGGGGVLDRAARLLQGARGTHAQGKARMKAEFARVTTTVEVDPKDAFEVFTEEIEAWWKP